MLSAYLQYIYRRMKSLRDTDKVKIGIIKNLQVLWQNVLYQNLRNQNIYLVLS